MTVRTNDNAERRVDVAAFRAALAVRLAADVAAAVERVASARPDVRSVVHAPLDDGSGEDVGALRVFAVGPARESVTVPLALGMRVDTIVRQVFAKLDRARRETEDVP